MRSFQRHPNWAGTVHGMSQKAPWLAPFSSAFQDAIQRQLAGPQEGDLPKLACFDADGTLWNEDLGEALFRWLAAGRALPALGPKPDPFEVWNEYESRVARNRAEGYGWAVQCMAGLPVSEVERWCGQLAYAWPTYRPAMVELIKGLRGAGYDVWLVSASNAWVIEASAPFVGAEREHVLGMRVEVEAGVLTDRLVRPLTCNQGKVDAIVQRLGRTPDLAVGDSLGDLEMLASAKAGLVVGRLDKPHAELPKLAPSRGWPVHLF